MSDGRVSVPVPYLFTFRLEKRCPMPKKLAVVMSGAVSLGSFHAAKAVAPALLHPEM